MNTVLKTEDNQSVLMQITRFGAIPTTGETFSLPSGAAFVIKNDSEEAVSVTIMPALGDFLVTTNLQPGWNPELVRSINIGPADLLWGY
jgi:hypothetical protein